MEVSVSGNQDLAEIASSFGEIGFLETYYKIRAADQLSVIKWCQFHGLLAKVYICPVCSRPMKLAPRKDTSDEFCWSCRSVAGGKHHLKRSIRSGTLFELSHLGIPDILMISFMWCAKLPLRFMVEQLQIGLSTVQNWATVLREVCFEIYLTWDKKIGGPNKVVEIAEGKFGERKINTENIRVGQHVIGGIERGSGRCFFFLVEDRTRETLLSVIDAYILPGTTIVPDCWKEYGCLSHEDFTHLKLSQSLTFQGDDPGVHTNTIRGTWNAYKTGFHPKINVFDPYLAENIWQKSSISTKEKMKLFFPMCVRLYPPNTKDPADAQPQKRKKIAV